LPTGKAGEISERRTGVRRLEERSFSESIPREIEGLQGQIVPKSREKYRELLRKDSRSNDRTTALSGPAQHIVWRLQAEAEGA
jgi:hypothetical protein